MIRRQKKSVQALNYLANKEPNKEINRLKALKILWLSDKYHLLKYRRTILKDKYYAMKNGPVPSDTIDISNGAYWDYAKQFITAHQLTVKSVNSPDLSLFSKSDLEALDHVWEKFGSLTQWQLRDLSHKYPEWKRFEEALLNPFTANSYPMEMLDFFDIPTGESDSMADFFNLPKEVIFESQQTFYHRKQFENSNR